MITGVEMGHRAETLSFPERRVPRTRTQTRRKPPICRWQPQQTTRCAVAAALYETSLALVRMQRDERGGEMSRRPAARPFIHPSIHLDAQIKVSTVTPSMHAFQFIRSTCRPSACQFICLMSAHHLSIHPLDHASSHHPFNHHLPLNPSVFPSACPSLANPSVHPSISLVICPPILLAILSIHPSCPSRSRPQCNIVTLQHSVEHLIVANASEMELRNGSYSYEENKKRQFQGQIDGKSRRGSADSRSSPALWT